MLYLPYRSCIFLSFVYSRAWRLQNNAFWYEKLVYDKLLESENNSIGSIDSMRGYYVQMFSINHADIGSERYQSPGQSLQYAGKKGDLWLILYFLRKHAYDKREKTISIYSPHYEDFLTKAIENGHVHIVKYFLDNLHISLRWNWIDCLYFAHEEWKKSITSYSNNESKYKEIYTLFWDKCSEKMKREYKITPTPCFYAPGGKSFIIRRQLVVEDNSYYTWCKWTFNKLLK